MGNSLAANPQSPGIGGMAVGKPLSMNLPAQAPLPHISSAMGAWSAHQPGAVMLHCIFFWQGNFLEGLDHCEAISESWQHLLMLSWCSRASHESDCELVSFLCSMSDQLRRGNARACSGNGCSIIFLTRSFFFFLLSLCFLTCVMTCLFQADCSFKTEPYCDGECQGLLMGDTEAVPEHSDIPGQQQTWLGEWFTFLCAKPSSEVLLPSLPKQDSQGKFSLNQKCQPGLWDFADRD